MTVANNSPTIIAIAIGSHISPPPRYKGIKPIVVVKVVNKIKFHKEYLGLLILKGDSV